MSYFHHTIHNTEEIDLFIILAGQSNALGQTDSQPPTRPELIGDINNAFIWDTDNYYTLNYPSNNQGSNFASELSLAYNYTTIHSKPIYIEKVAKGGTPIFNDASGDDWNVSSDELIEDLKDAVSRISAKAISLGAKNPKFVLIWIQGERDARYSESIDYTDNFSDILSEINAIKQMDLVILNVLNKNLINGPGFTEEYLNNVISAQKSLKASIDYIENINMNKYQLGLDILHYGSEQQEEIGDDIYELIKRKFRI